MARIESHPKGEACAMTTAAAAHQKSKRGLAVYLAVGFIGAWTVWIVCALMARHGTPGGALVSIVIAGSFAPFLASGLGVWRDNGARAALRFYGRGLDWRMGWSVFGVSVLAIPLLGVAVAAASGALAGHSLSFQMGWKDVPYAYVWLLILGGPLAEEFGWSYLSDRLDEWLAPFSSNLVLGLIWALWHLPLFFLLVPGLDQSFIPYPVFVVAAVCFRFLMAWCYHRGGRNILSNLLAHNGMNFALSLVPIVLPVHSTPQWRLVALGALSGLSAAVLYRLAPVTPRGVP
jgi:uncharacterized protein